jgi:hypothetical protein
MDPFVGWFDAPKAEKHNGNDTFLWAIDPFVYKIDRIHSFDIRHSLFDIQHSLFQSFLFDQTGRLRPEALFT